MTEAKGAVATIWWELKATVMQLLPYGIMVWLLWMYNTQQNVLMVQHISALETQISEQVKVLSSIRDTLTQRGLVVPPFGETN
tara:strand:+ start:1278 stop:1526 length:249 start_codon:yes stop_codon:yes gene_type:complete